MMLLNVGVVSILNRPSYTNPNMPQMTDYTDLPTRTLVQHEIGRYVFNTEKSDEITQHLTQILIDLIHQRGFHDYEPQCIAPLQTCLIDFYKDLLIRFKQHIESVGSSITFQNALERTLDDVMSINLHELHHYMKTKY